MDASTDFSLVQYSSQHISKWGEGKGHRKRRNQEPDTKEAINGHKIDQREIEDEVGTLIWSLSLP